MLDRATYHTVLEDDDKWPIRNWNKRRLAESTLRWGGAPENWPLTWVQKKTKSQILKQARSMYPTPKYKS